MLWWAAVAAYNGRIVSALSIQVDNEIGHLEQVMIHRPGDEVVRMTQHDLDRLLFDDILSLERTVREHDLMTEIFRAAGTGVIEVNDLLEEALRCASSAERELLVAEVCQLNGMAELVAPLLQLPAEKLAGALVHGAKWDELDEAPMSLARVRRGLLQPNAPAIDPLPNLMFMRDPCIVFGDSVAVGRMATRARAAEPRLVAFAIEHGGIFEQPKLTFLRDATPRAAHYRRFEGGDVLVLSPELLLIGCSQRTSAQTIERVAHEALFEHHPDLARIYVVMMPEQRTVMHLDTVITQADSRLFLGYAPGVTSGGASTMPVACVERSGSRLLPGVSVLDVLRDVIGSDVELIPCGGDDPLHQQREQWTDGANALCLAPGRILLYERNVRTIAALVQQGFEEIALHPVQPPEQRAALIARGMASQRAVFSFPASELSRARGGGRCLTMPLRRAPTA